MRIKDVVEIKNDKTADTSMPYVALENIVSWDAKFVESNSETEGINNVFKAGDILFGKLRPYLAKGFIPTYDGICSTEFFVMKAKKGYDANYLLKVFLSHSFIDHIRNQVSGVKMPRTSWDVFGSISIDIPPLPIQRRIVSYLDTKTIEIDRKINLLERKRDAYLRLKTATINHAVTRGLNPNAKLKDSGIEWIGLVPEHWEVIRLKDMGYLYSGLTGKSGDDFRNDDDSVTKLYIPFTNILYNLEVSPDLLNRVVMEESEYQNKVKKGDLIFLMSSEDYESIAKSAVVSEDIGEVYLNSFCRGYRIVKNNVDPIFVNFQLNSIIYRNRLRLEARGFTRINMKVDKIASMSVVLPSYDDQRKIVAYLREQCKQIDKMISTIDQQTELYTRLKRSLINEVVTGQRTV